MAAGLRIADGTPVWLSTSLVPSRDNVVSPSSSPNLATVHVNDTGVYVYVKVENTGTVDLGGCICTVPVPAPWALVALFTGFVGNPNTTQTDVRGGVTFTARPSSNAAGDTLSGAVNFSFGVVASGHHAWGWSPDGRFFAHVSSFSVGKDWSLSVVSLQPFQRADGSSVAAGQMVASASGVYDTGWNAKEFGWAGSSAVIAAGIISGGGIISRTILCPYAPAGMNVIGDSVPDQPNQVAWDHRVSPCGAVVALVPRIAPAAPPRSIEVFSTVTAKLAGFRKNNAPITVDISGSAPTITTLQHTANGVRVVTGGGSVDVDDPECAGVGGGVQVVVDRVKASTLPTANLGVAAIGSAVLSKLDKTKSAWVQVPNVNPSGWANQSERHWCLLGQTFTVDGSTIVRPWNGQSPNPPPFPVTLQNCAQCNIEILP